MGRNRERRLRIVEDEIAAICADAGLACDDPDQLLRQLEAGNGAVRNLSGPICESLVSLLTLRRQLLDEDDSGG